MREQDVWIARQNIEHFDRLLQTTRDEKKREVLHRLKADAEAKVKQVDGVVRSRWPGS